MILSSSEGVLPKGLQQHLFLLTMPKNNHTEKQENDNPLFQQYEMAYIGFPFHDQHTCKIIIILMGFCTGADNTHSKAEILL